MLSFTLVVIQEHNKLIMLFREKAPNKHKWNFVGGKIEQGESIVFAAKREAEEETGLTLHNLHFRGIVKWNNTDGMYVYYANNFTGSIDSSNEGNVEWKEIDWILDSNKVVSNIPHFLPHILNVSEAPLLHHFEYDSNGQIIQYEKSSLKERLFS